MEKLCAAMGKMKFLLCRYASGKMGSAARRSAARNATPARTEKASRPSTSGLDHPKLGRKVNARRKAATQAAIDTAPAQSSSSSSHLTCRRPAARSREDRHGEHRRGQQ